MIVVVSRLLQPAWNKTFNDMSNQMEEAYNLQALFFSLNFRF